MIIDVKKYLLDLQNRICQMLELEDTNAKFIEDKWQYENGSGGGLTRVLTGGAIIEKAGVNFSHVKGMKLPEAATVNRPGLTHSTFEAMGVSVVIHPLNPYIPTTHMNVRCILVEKENEEPYWWFGGGFDLTPYYGFEEDCVHWHKTAKEACDAFGDDVYPKYKKWCDDYFYLNNRQEPRGIGGVFFDDLRDWDFETCFNFIKNIGDGFIKAYQPIVAKRKSMTYGTKEREFQLMRRGRYVEFNLLYDRGTLFGLQSGGRTESILMSLPPQVSWVYDFKAAPNTPEADLYEKFLKPRDWLGIKKQ